MSAPVEYISAWTQMDTYVSSAQPPTQMSKSETNEINQVGVTWITGNHYLNGPDELKQWKQHTTNLTKHKQLIIF